MKYKNMLYIAINFIALQAFITLATANNLWSGVVTNVTDGDTLWVRPSAASSDSVASSKPRKIRIDGIDAPESCQLYGVQSTAALKKLIL